MRRFSLIFVILGCVALAALLAWVALFDGRTRQARDMPVSPPVFRAVEPFTHVEISGHAEVVLVQGGETSVLVETPGRKPAQVDIAVSGDTLEIHATSRLRWWDFLLGRSDVQSANIVVTFKDLKSIAAAGAVRVIADGIRVPDLTIEGAGGTSIHIDRLQAEKLDISGAGALKAEIGGAVGTQRIAISGAGEYRGARLASDDASVTVSGAGRVTVNARRTLNVRISGAGSVDYLGDPKVTEDISGAGSVRRRGTTAAVEARVPEV